MFIFFKACFLLHIICSCTNGLPLICDRHIDIAIIGAGTAGTYAAYRLRDLGLKTEIFEYSDRIGGRAHTTTLENVPDLNLDLGPMRFIGGAHEELESVAEELNLTVEAFTEGFGRLGRTRYNLRGVTLTAEEVLHGDIPYDLSPEEKANQHRLIPYYLEKLTGYNMSYLSGEEYLQLKVLGSDTELHKLSFDEAMDLVATSEGKEFTRALAVFTSVSQGDSSTLYLFTFSSPEPGATGIFTLKEGMGALPMAMAKAFTNEHSTNKINLNTMLYSVRHIKLVLPITYQLRLVKTATQDGITTPLWSQKENVCANKVILAISQTSLSYVDWWPLGEPKVQEALYAVRPIPLSKVFLTFPNCWWISSAVENPAYVMTTDTKLAQMYDWKQSNVTGDCAMLASYSENDNTRFQEGINQYGDPILGSAPGAFTVREGLKNGLLEHFSDVFGIPREQIPEPKSAIAGFWHSYPAGGGVTLWKAGYNFTEVGYTIRRPSPGDDVFVVGSDFSFGGDTTWMVGAFRTVNEVIDNYF